MSHRSGRQHRSYDQESGMNRTTRGGRRQQRAAPPPPVSSDESGDYTDSEVEVVARAAVRDDSRRQRTTLVRRPAARGAPQQQNPQAQEATHEDVEEVRPVTVTTATHRAFLLALGRNSIQAPLTYPEVNHYIPDAGNMFYVVYEMTRAVGENTLLFERCPGYNSLALAIYYGYVYYYQILRAREDAGHLTRLERRSLKIFESIGKPESWPIATPLIGFVQALGSCESPDKMFSHVIPAFVRFGSFTTKKGLTGLSTVPGAARTPIIPAMQEYLRRFGTDKTDYNATDLVFYPAKTPLSNTNTFVGIEASDATDLDFQALAFNQCWNIPSETSEPIGNFTVGQKQASVARWRVPKVEDKEDFQAMETFLFGDGERTHWIKELIKVSAHVNRFFPGSTNLSAIPPTTTMENFTPVTYEKTGTARAAEKDKWFHTRSNWTITSKANYFGDQSTPLVIAALSTSTNSEFKTSVVPAALEVNFRPLRSGPYFVNATGTETKPVPQSEGVKQQDPMARCSEIINSTMYDNKGEN